MALKRSVARAVVHLRQSAEASATAASRKEPPLREKFTLARLNGGRSPFDVSSDRLLKARAKVSKPAEAQMKDVYSLEYLLGRSAAQDKPRAANPFQTASSKLM